ncbi:hypothetical protein PTKIN_Ptkin01aG0098400 [Pterospermum kingtungense]
MAYHVLSLKTKTNTNGKALCVSPSMHCVLAAIITSILSLARPHPQRGGGTAGCPLAANLSQSFQVLVLERGSIPYSYLHLMTQEGFLTTLTKVSTYDSPSQSFTSDNGVQMPADEFLVALVPPMLKGVVFRPELKNWQSTVVRDGLIEAGLILTNYDGFSLDHLAGTKVGGSAFDSSGAHDEMGRYQHAMVREHGEVLLCAAAIGSPQLLLLSGIGRKPYLTSWGFQLHITIHIFIPFTSPSRSVFIRTLSSPLLLTLATIMEKIVVPVLSGSLRNQASGHSDDVWEIHWPEDNQRANMNEMIPLG